MTELRRVQIQSTEESLAKAEKIHKRWWCVIGDVGGVIILVICAVLVLSACRKLPETQPPAPTPMPTLAPTLTSMPSPTFTPMPPLIFTPEPLVTHTAAPIATSAPAASPGTTPMPEVAAVVGADGADLRSGATTWWHVRRTLPAGTEVELSGFDPDFPDWVYVRAPDGDTGWTQIANLEIHREMDTLPRVTPRSTLRPMLISPTPLVPVSCAPGFLRLSYWPMSTDCNADGTWTARIFAAGRGGDCNYIYLWEGEVKGGPQSGPIEFEIVKPWAERILGEVSVTSAGQIVIEGLFIDPPRCP